MSEREVFEVWLKSGLYGLSLNLDKSAHETYNSTVAHWAWRAWQASAANQQARIEFLEKALEQAVTKAKFVAETSPYDGSNRIAYKGGHYPASITPELAAYLKEKQ